MVEIFVECERLTLHHSLFNRGTVVRVSDDQAAELIRDGKARLLREPDAAPAAVKPTGPKTARPWGPPARPADEDDGGAGAAAVRGAIELGVAL